MRVRALGLLAIVVAALGLSACTSSTEAGSTTAVLGLGSALTSPATTGPTTAGRPTTSAVAASGSTSTSSAPGSPTSAPTTGSPSTPAPAAAGSTPAPVGPTPTSSAAPPRTPSAPPATTTSPTGTPTSPATDEAEPQTADAGAAATPAVLDVCSALPVATVSQDTGLGYTQQFPSSAAGIDECEYDNDDSSIAGVSVSVLDDADGEVWTTVHEAGVTDVPGLGDKAMWDDQNALYAEKGTHLVQVDGDSLTQDQARALAAIVVAALP